MVIGVLNTLSMRAADSQFSGPVNNFDAGIMERYFGLNLPRAIGEFGNHKKEMSALSLNFNFFI